MYIKLNSDCGLHVVLDFSYKFEFLFLLKSGTFFYLNVKYFPSLNMLFSMKLWSKLGW